ncbi:DUF349 domain-containing protein [Cnuibacter sp. UC19_7]|uniref:DUF349 domain-containing protein n=1 Tax=Cnuibacter sp. UC19_7 TaxID=3350166 RepID=UPI00366AA5B7
MTSSDQQPWGRVDDDGNVYVREADGERLVGQFPDGSKEEALAYFERKYTDLAGQVTLLEQRARRGAPAADVAKTVARLTSAVDGANAVGDLEALKTRLAALTTTVSEISEQQSAEAEAEVQAAVAERTAIVEQIEALAAQDPAKAQWKQVSATIDELFGRWQAHQHDGPRLPRAEANELWRRFRDARTSLETQRRAFFAELDQVHKEARSRKQQLVEQAEALASRGADGIPAYRDLLAQWKGTGRAGRKYDDALWDRFKAAGDVLYGARSEVVARDEQEYGENLTAKLALLDEAEPLLKETDRVKAREALTSIQLRWDAIGRVPRDNVKTVEERLRRVETAVRKLDEEHWNRSDPEKKARSEGLASQLSGAIEKLQKEIDEAQAAGDSKKVKELQESLDARKIWLDALG